MSRTELFVNFNQVEFELKKVRFKLKSSFETNQILSNQAESSSIWFNSFSALLVVFYVENDTRRGTI